MAHICKTSLYCAKKYYLKCVVSSIRKFSCFKRNLFLRNNSIVLQNKLFIRKNLFNDNMKFYTTSLMDDEFLPEIDTSYYENSNGTEYIKEKNIRSILYPDSDDPIMNKLKKCSTIQDVLDIIEDKYDVMNHQHVCQTVLILWDLQQSFHKQYIANLGKQDIEYNPETLYKEYAQELSSHKVFNDFLQLLSSNVHLLSVQEVTCAILYLKRIRYENGSPLLQKLIDRGRYHLKSSPSDWDLSSLERFTNSMKSRDILHFAYLAVESIPLILDFLKNCNSANDLITLTECLDNIHIVVSLPMLTKYKEKCFELIDSGIVTNENIDTVLTIINFLHLFHWSKHNINDLIYLCKFLKPSIHKMNATDVINLHKVFQTHSEPSSIIEDIKKKVTYLLEEIKYDDRVKAYLKLPDLLYCQITMSGPNNRIIMENFLRDLIKTTFPANLMSIFNSLRYLKIPDYNICNIYWKQISTHLVNNEHYSNRLLQFCYKYMYFNLNFGEPFRSQDFENAMLKKLYHVIEHEEASFITAKFSRIISFVIAYGLTRSLNDAEYTSIEKIMHKFQDHFCQIGYIDYFILSRGIQIFNQLSKNDNNKIYNLVTKVNTNLDKCSEHFLKLNDCNLNELNILCKSYINRKSIYESEHFYSILYKYNFIDDKEISTRLIKQAVYNFITTNTFVPKFINQVEEYVANNDEIYADVTHKILQMCFLSGSHPKNEKFYTVLIHILKRDKDIMNGLTLLQYCVALAYYGHLTDDLVKYVFSLEFLERLDTEIDSCYSKKTYPKRLRLQMMILNRIVCLDYPQHEIPWFHQKYVEEFIAFKHNKRTIFAQDVMNTLANITKNTEVLQKQHFSPYGYKVDFYLQLDENKNILEKSVHGDNNINTKVAILLLSDQAYGKIFTIDDCKSKHLKTGFFSRRKNCTSQLRSRHLEQLGYQVIEISNAFWNSMYMAEPNAKINYLKNKLRK